MFIKNLLFIPGLSKEDLTKKLMTVWTALNNTEPDVNPFREPVDAVKLGIPVRFVII